MERTQVNPWSWQDQFGFSQGWRIDDGRSVIFVSGQGSLSAEGEVLGAGDFEAQTRQTFENLRTVLEAAGASLQSIVKLTVFLIDVANVFDFTRIKGEFIQGPQPASSAVGVAALALPGMMIEVEATAVV
jgi:enamine deaminase RidA (YjgF/YER057c/UK114 family)